MHINRMQPPLSGAEGVSRAEVDEAATRGPRAYGLGGPAAAARSGFSVGTVGGADQTLKHITAVLPQLRSRLALIHMSYRCGRLPSCADSWGSAFSPAPVPAAG